MIERLVILKQRGWVDEDELPQKLTNTPPTPHHMLLPSGGVDFGQTVDAFETNLILQALAATGWNKNQAAKMLCLKRTTLVEKIRSKRLQRSS